MREITKQNLPVLVNIGLRAADISVEKIPNLALSILLSNAIKLSEPISRPSDIMEMVVIGGRSKGAIRTAGNLVNVFALASAIQTATAAPGLAQLASPILLGVLGACSTKLSPKHAAFFVAANSLRDRNTIPTAAALAAECSNILPGNAVSKNEILTVADDLLKMGVPLHVGEQPNHIIHHEEWTISVPGF